MTAASTAPQPLCIQHSPRSSTGLAAIATIAVHHGLRASVPALRTLTGLAGPAELDGVQMVFAASRCGLRAIPLEGDFEQLPEVPLPAIVTFTDSRHLVLVEVDGESAHVGDTATGEVRLMTRDELKTMDGRGLSGAPASG